MKIFKLLINIFIILSMSQTCFSSSFHTFNAPPQPQIYNPNYSTINNTPYYANPNYSQTRAQKRLYRKYLRDKQLLNQQYYNQNTGFWKNVKNALTPNGYVTGVSPIVPYDTYYNSDTNFYNYDNCSY